MFIGMAGVGKSTVSKALAKHLGYTLIELDHVIEETHGKKLQEIYDQQGRDAFEAIELQAILDLGDRNQTIISPGGSVIYYPEGMQWFKENATVIYLKDSLHNIRRRIPNLETRGIVGLKEKGLQTIFDERCKLCEQYQDITVNLPVPFRKKTVLSTVLKELHEHNIL